MTLFHCEQEQLDRKTGKARASTEYMSSTLEIQNIMELKQSTSSPFAIKMRSHIHVFLISMRQNFTNNDTAKKGGKKQERKPDAGAEPQMSKTLFRAASKRTLLT